jgi:hypothetical protein
MENEVWKDIKGYEGLYQVSNLGRVKSLDRIINYSNGLNSKHKGKILTKEKTRDNYNRVTLSLNNKQKRFQVHRLVAKHFLKNINNKPCVNHIDGNKLNNIVENLEWCTYSENEIHSYNFLSKINSNRKLKIEDVDYILLNYIKGRKGNIRDLAFKFKVDVTTIYNVIKGKYYV